MKIVFVGIFAGCDYKTETGAPRQPFSLFLSSALWVGHLLFLLFDCEFLTVRGLPDTYAAKEKML